MCYLKYLIFTYNIRLFLYVKVKYVGDVHIYFSYVYYTSGVVGVHRFSNNQKTELRALHHDESNILF
jgi:hypothetical protein